jgi:Fasciclin domain
MSDRGPHGQDPTEVFPPLRPDPPTPPATLPPVGTERDPDPTRVMGPGDSDPLAVPPTGGPYEPGPPYGGGGEGGGGGGGEPPFEPEPEPWYRQPGPLAALIAGLAALIVALIALAIWASGGDDSSNDTLPTVVSTTTTTTSPSTTTTTERATTTTSPATTTSSTTTTLPPTTTTTTTPPTTTLPPTTTTTTTPPTTAAPTTTTTTTPITNPPPGATAWDVISATPSLSSFKQVITDTNTEGFFQGTTAYTVLAPDNDAMKNAKSSFDVTDYITEGTISSAELFQMPDIAMQSGERLKVDNATQTIGGAVMTASRDIEVSNGVIQVMAGLVTPE